MLNSSPQWALSFDADVSPHERKLIREALAPWSPAVLGARRIHVSPLPGGANNLNFTIEGGTVKAALRIANPHPENLGIDRGSAQRAQMAAAQLGIAPRVLASSLPSGDLLCEFVEGEPLGPTAFDDRHVLKKVATVLRTLHQASADVRPWSPFDDIRIHVRRADEKRGAFPDRWSQMIDVCGQLEKVLAHLGLPQALTHNDLVPQNFILGSGRLCLVDWDWAGYGSPLFELGSLACTAQLRPEQINDLLSDYNGAGATREEQRLVTAMSFVASVREVAWAVSSLASLVGGEQVNRSFYEHHRDWNLVVGLRLLDGEELDRLLRSPAG